MATNDGRNGAGNGAGNPEDVELSKRLQRLERRLGEARTPEPDRAGPVGSGSEPSALGRAFRLSTEFVAGIIAGAGIGWVLDSFAGTRPWGLVVFTMLGFGAGIWNVLRASGFIRPPGSGGGNAAGSSG